MHKPILLPSVYNPRLKDTSFEVMIEMSQYKNSIFIFNDDQHAFRYSKERGRGNAVIRPYSNAFGIPTGVRRGRENIGYSSLNTFTKQIIDESLDLVRKVVCDNKYDYVIYSANRDGSLGTGYFVVCDDVKTYIVQQLNLIVGM
jgi:hypothetical protein